MKDLAQFLLYIYHSVILFDDSMVLLLLLFPFLLVLITLATLEWVSRFQTVVLEKKERKKIDY